MIWSFDLIKLATVAVLSFSVQVYALNPAQDLVEKMSITAKNLSYKGYFTHERGQQSSSYEIVHWVQNDLEKQRLVFLDGPALEIINDGHSLKCLHAGDIEKPYALPTDRMPVVVRNHSLLSVWENYNAEITGSSRVANRKVVRIQLDPKDQHRYPFVFYVDNETGLMLKMLVLNHQGQLLERFHFVSVDYQGVTESDLLPKIKDYKVVNHSPVINDNTSNSGKSWRPSWIPRGFEEEKAVMNNGQAAKERQVYMFSDGLSAFSVFVENFEGDVKSDTSTQTGSTSAMSHYTLFDGQIYLVTVVGEVPIMTARQIALSMRPSS